MVFTANDPGSVAENLTETASDWYQTAGVWALVLTVLFFLLWLVAAIAIAKKAGFSGWWGALFILVPFISWILFGLFAILKWPVTKQRDEARGVVRSNDLTLPSEERAAIKEAERKQAIEDQARRNMEKAQAERIKAEEAKARFAASSQALKTAAPAADAKAAPAPAASSSTAEQPPSGAVKADKPAAKKAPTADHEKASTDSES